MTRILLPALLALLLAPAALAAPESEARPDCEADQPWVFYGTSDPARRAYADAGAPGALRLCEGEHWDGQDPLRDDARACPAAVDAAAERPHADACLGADPNHAAGEDPLAPLAARASADGSAVYLAANAAFLTRVAVYADGSTLALYARDNTPGNVIAHLVSGPRITPVTYESDCDQETYQRSAYGGPWGEDGRYLCGRDNTALTLEHGLLP